MITHFLIVPILIWGAVALSTLIVGTVVISNRMKEEVTKSHSIGILGTVMSGKTLFLKRLQNERVLVEYVSSGIDPFEEFELTLSNGKKVKIKKGVDIGGGEDILSQYDKIISNSDMLFFFFDSSKVEDNQYFREMSMRLDFTYEMIRKYNKKIKLWLIGSHIDKSYKNEQELKKYLTTKLVNMKYMDIIDFERINFINLQDEKSVKELINKVF